MADRVDPPRLSSRRSLLTASLGAAGLAVVATLASRLPAEPDDDYPLDEVSRKVPRRGPLSCPKVELIIHTGQHIRYALPARVNPSFRDRLVLFEKLARDLAIEHYGRAPLRLVQSGTFNCRRIRAYPDWISEHGLGNAIDIEGFDFGPLEAGAALPTGRHRSLRGPFSVRVLSHWKARHPLTEAHAGFLRELARRTIARRDIFRVLLGPSYPGHQNHFHFDCSPYRMVDVFAADEA